MQPMKLITTAAAFATTASALLVAPNSPCSQYCGNVLTNTTADAMTCDEHSYGSTVAGSVFETCIGCELGSTYVSPDTSDSSGQTDLQWLIYNLRYTISFCLFGVPANDNHTDSPCSTSFACGQLFNAVDYGNLSMQVGAFDFCNNWNHDSLPKCSSCLLAGQNNFLNNYFIILDAACQQLPAPGSALSLKGSPFSTVPVNITTPTPTPLYTFTPHHTAISLGGEVGIAVGGFALLLFVTGFLVICFGRRRRRAFLKTVEARYSHSGGPMVQNGLFHTRDMFDTPLSQKPLRAWDNSPVSATTDRGEIGPFPRYFSPYNSNYNSPVSAVDGQPRPWPVAPPDPNSATASANVVAGSSSEPAAAVAQTAVDPGVGSSNLEHEWPKLSREEIERLAREQDLPYIGIALGGSDPSIRSKTSNTSMSNAHADLATLRASPGGAASTSNTLQTQATPHQPLESGAQDNGKGKTPLRAPEVYELREIDSNGMPTAPVSSHAPVLQQPNHGRGTYRYYPPPPQPEPELPPELQSHPLPLSSPTSPYGGLTEEDARLGHAV